MIRVLFDRRELRQRLTMEARALSFLLMQLAVVQQLDKLVESTRKLDAVARKLDLVIAEEWRHVDTIGGIELPC